MSEDAVNLDFAAAQEAEGTEALILALDAFEGPLHLLLELARAKKVDLARVSVTEIANQYLAFIAEARATQIELAGDYLVMAAWLAYLKSRLLIPKQQAEEEALDADQLALALRVKLLRLERARAAAEALKNLPQLGAEIFVNGAPQPFALTKTNAWQASLYDLLQSYCADRTRTLRRVHRPRPRRAYPLAEARKRLEKLLDQIPDWRPIEAVTPPPEEGAEAPPPASYLASVFGATLELSREGRMEFRQAEAFAPLFLRARKGGAQNKP
ncbi:MAG: ScpA family protein [Caulobacterales bacterium]